MEPVPKTVEELHLRLLNFQKEMADKYAALNASIDETAKIHNIAFPILGSKRSAPAEASTPVKKISVAETIDAKLGILSAQLKPPHLEKGTLFMNKVTNLHQAMEKRFVEALANHREILITGDFATTLFLGTPNSPYDIELNRALDEVIKEYSDPSLDEEAKIFTGLLLEKMKLLQLLMYFSKEMNDNSVPIPSSKLQFLCQGPLQSCFGHLTVARQVNGIDYNDPILTLYFSCVLFTGLREATIDKLISNHLPLKETLSITLSVDDQSLHYSNINWYTLELLRLIWLDRQDTPAKCEFVFKEEHIPFLLQPVGCKTQHISHVIFPLEEAIFPFCKAIENKEFDGLFKQLGTFILKAAVQTFKSLPQAKQGKLYLSFKSILKRLHALNFDVQIPEVKEIRNYLEALDIVYETKQNRGLGFLNANQSRKKALDFLEPPDLYTATHKSIRPIESYFAKGKALLDCSIFGEKTEETELRKRLTQDRRILRAYLCENLNFIEQNKEFCSLQLMQAISTPIEGIIAKTKCLVKVAHLLLCFKDNLQMKKVILRVSSNLLSFSLNKGSSDPNLGKTYFTDFYKQQFYYFIACIRMWPVQINGNQVTFEKLME